MYTMLLIASIVAFIATLSGTIIYYFYWGTKKLDYKSNQKYPIIYNQAEQKILEDEAIRNLKNPMVAIGSLFFIFLSIVGIADASHFLAKYECEHSRGVFVSWDFGLQWECYNPNNIQSDNNLRIIHENGE